MTKIGRPDLATEAMGIYQGDVYVLLHPSDTWTSGRTKDDLIDAMAEALGRGAGRRVQLHAADGDAPRRGRVGREGGRRREGVRARTRPCSSGSASRCGACWHRCPGAADLQVEVLSGAAQLEIVADRAQMARYGLNVAHVRELVETAIGGATATEVLDGSRRFDVVVRFPDAIRANPEAIAGLLLTAPGGERVPLGNVAERRGPCAGPRPSTTRTASGGWSCRPTCAAATSAASSPRRSGGSRARCTLPGGLPPGVGRPVREPAARDAAPHARDPAVAGRSSSCCCSSPSARCGRRGS